jgi:HEAT repeat protein
MVPVGLAFFIAGLCKTGIIITTNHYFLTAVDDRDRVGTSMFIRMISGGAAGFAGSVGGGTILKILGILDVSGLDLYRTYFRIIILVFIPFLITILRLEPLKEWKVRNILGLIFSPRDLRALFVMNKLDKNANPETDRTHVETLGRLASGLSESTLRSLLDSPRLNVRFRALQALRQINFGKKTAAEFIRELQHGEFTTAWVAAEILGEKGVTEAIPELRKGLESSDQFLRGKCMVALVRLEDRETYETIRQIFRNDTNPRIIIHGANALVGMGERSSVGLILERTSDPEVKGTVYDEILTAVATMCGCGERVYRFLREYNTDREEAMSLLYSSCEEIEGKIGRSLDLFSSIQNEHVPGTTLTPIIEYMRRNGEGDLQTVSNYLDMYGREKVNIKMFYFITVVLTDHYRRARIEYPFDQ